MHLKKMLPFILGLLMLATQVHALTFKAGDQASFTLTRKTEIKEKPSLSMIQQGMLALDVKILSDNHESFPFDVEITIKKLNDSIVMKEKNEVSRFAFDSASTQNNEDTQELSKLIDVPLHFTITAPFEVKETSDILSTFEIEWDSPADIDFYGASTSFYIAFLTQLFHLSGENLVVDRNYPISSCYRFLDFDEDQEDWEEYETLEHEGCYTITNLDQSTIHGTFNMIAKSSWKFLFKFTDTLSANGQVTWNLDHPLVQNRTTHITQTSSSVFEKIKLEATETWMAVPLE